MKILEVFVVFCLGLAGLTNANVCSIDNNAENLLKPNEEYTYKFESHAISEAAGNVNDKSKISILCDIFISDSECAFILKLEQCKVKASSETKEFGEVPWIDETLKDISRYSIKFKLENGEISSVYSNPDDPIYFVNIKKAVISAFVFKLSYTSSKDICEKRTDIHGTCPVTINSDQSSDGFVKISKNMQLCSFPSRKNAMHSPWSLFSNMSLIQHLINSTTDCDYRIDTSAGRIDGVSCRERHAITRDSYANAALAVETNIHYTLTYVESRAQRDKPDFSSGLTRKTGIQFEYESPSAHAPNTGSETFIPIAKKVLLELVEDSKEDIRLHTIPQFTDFVSFLRTASNVIPFVEEVKSCSFLPETLECTADIKDRAFSFLSDALVQCNTLPCIEAIVHLAKNKDLSEAYLSFIYFTWGFNAHYNEPAIFKAIEDLCVSTNSDLCFMSLGSLLGNRAQSESFDYTEELHQLKEIAKGFFEKISKQCSLPMDDDTHSVEEVLKNLRIISNMGDGSVILVPDGFKYLVDCLTSSYSHTNIKITVLEVIKSLKTFIEIESCDYAYDNVLLLLKNNSLPTALRALSYEYLLELSYKNNFDKELVNILKEDEDLQLKSFIASSLNSLFSETNLKYNERRFIKSVKKLLIQHEISLESFIHHPSGPKSFTSTQAISAKIPFEPHTEEKFRLKFKNSYIYQQSDVFPKYFHRNILMDILDKFINFVKINGVTEGLEDLVIVFQRALTGSKLDLFKILEALEEVVKEIGSKGSNFLKEYNFDKEVIENIMKLEGVYRNFNPKSQPSLYAYINLFGSTLKTFSLKDIVALKSQLNRLLELADGKTHVFNSTRVIRLIEAHHQIPTLMGLPLNWTADATLAISLRSGLKMELDRDTFAFHSRGYLQPSAALTFLNRMVIDFPSVTKIGLQSNSSGYTSTNFKANLDYSDKKKVFSIKKPSKSEKILELYRTNQMIKHGNYTDIPDWDMERSTSTKCTDSELSSMVGLQFCLAESHLLETKGSKASHPMGAGQSNWRLYFESYDEKLTSYDFEIVQLPGSTSREFILKLSTPGSDKKREVILLKDKDEDKGELKFDVKVTALPNFALSFVKTKIPKHEEQDGYRSIFSLSLDKNISYELQFHVDTNKKDELLIREERLSFSTPFNYYKYKREIAKMGEDANRTITLYHENLNPDGKWLHRILPPSFWENESKAWIKLKIDWKEPDIKENNVYRQTFSLIQLPQSSVELIGHSIEMDRSENIHLSLTKKDKNHKLLSFVNFTYDSIAIDEELVRNKIHVVNLTISRKSWSATMRKVIDGEKILYNITLKTANMRAKNPENQLVEWWQKDSDVDFDLEEKNVTFISEFKNDVVLGQELIEKYSIRNFDAENSNVRQTVMSANMLLYYPLHNGTHSFKLDGILVFSKSPHDFRFQNGITMECSYHNLEVKTHALYVSEEATGSLDYKATFIHMPTKKKAYHILKYHNVYSNGSWPNVNLKHNIRSNAFDFTSNLSLKNNSNGENLKTLKIFIKTNSSFWHMLDTSLEQIVDQVSPEFTYETCNFSHPLLKINVTADWRGKTEERRHQKKVVFYSPSGSYGSSELHYRKFPKRSTLDLYMPNDGERSLSYERILYSNGKKFNIQIDYENKKNKEERDNLELLGEIIEENLQVWKIDVNLEKLSSIKHLFLNAYKKVGDKIATISKDKDHPLNQILEPTLNGTIFDYYQGLLTEKDKVKQSICNEIKETLHSLKEFYEEPREIINNIVNISHETTDEISHYLENYSTIVWFIGHFNVVEPITKLYPLAFKLLLPEDQNIHLVFTTGRMLKWGSFHEWPSFSFQDLKEKFFPDGNPEIEPHYRPMKRAKRAMIFGPLHVHTFDETLYDSAEYSSDCSFLLAHDLRKSSFSVLSTKSAIHLLFPGVSVSVNDQNQVFINNSQVETSLPFVSPDGKVTVLRSSIVEVISPSLKVICSGKDFLCVLELRVWHHGGIFGLLGNADGLPSNDFMLPNGKLTTDVLEFVKSYEVSGKSECQNIKLPPSLGPPSYMAQESCRFQFFMLCDQKIQESFIDACQTDFEQDYQTCYAASAYGALCYFKSLKSRPIDCNGKKQESINIGHKLEIVFMVQEHSSFATETITDDIERILTAVEVKFKSSDYSSVLFSLISFGGKGANYQPTLYTSKNSTWVPVQALSSEMLKRLVFDGADADAVHALRYAVEVLGFDSFHSKVFITLTPKDKKRTDKQTLHLIRDQLEKNGITLYSLSTYPSIGKSKNLGIRADGSPLPAAAKKGLHLDFPRGDLAKLTAATGGAVFTSSVVEHTKFAEVFAQEVWDKVHTESSSCRRCTAVQGGWWWEVNRCSIVSC